MVADLSFLRYAGPIEKFVGEAQRPRPRWSRPSLVLRSESANVLRLGTLGALRDVELDLLVLVEGLVALRLNRGVVHEDVVAAVLLRNEAETLLGVEPLHGALSHLLVTPVIGTRV